MISRARLFVLLVVVLLVLFAAIAWVDARRNATDAICTGNLELLSKALKQYVHDDTNRGELYPPLASVPGRMMFRADCIFPKITMDTTALISPVHPDAEGLRERAAGDINIAVDDHSYWYLGYAMVHERSALAWVDAYKKNIPLGQPIEDVYEIWPEYVSVVEQNRAQLQKLIDEEIARGDRVKLRKAEPDPGIAQLAFYRPLQDGVERYLSREIGNPALFAELRASIPVMIERPELHGDGGHVLYLDGHVEFVLYPGRFPMVPSFIEALRSLDALERQP